MKISSAVLLCVMGAQQSLKQSPALVWWGLLWPLWRLWAVFQDCQTTSPALTPFVIGFAAEHLVPPQLLSIGRDAPHALVTRVAD
ncbi:exported hypothetical protein [Paraburkholderia ribeironis]|uniref:Uncharacterized protein n=1 Tax=Paraburkholderia ribeironis TaxID=1247936 RepID=A0A1N7S8S6_9BURK|nr:exported hypothetical protein [Paraburkholderia ribeironis]